MSQFPPFPPRRVAVPAALALLLGAAPARAQDSSATPSAPPPTLAQAAPSADAAFQRARTLVSEGHGAVGRAIVDSVLAAATPGSAQAAEALWWRASLAATSADAERDYRRLAVEHPVSPRSEDALLRLAQLELTRGDREQAVRHLERLQLEHPTGHSRPRAAYWMARIKFEMNDAAGACAAIAQARASTPPEEVELRNQIDFTARRCARIESARQADSSTVAAASPSAPPAATTTTPAAPVTAPATAASTTPAATAAGTPSPAAPRPAATTPAPAARNPTTTTTTTAPTIPPATGARTPSAVRTFAVQVAAFETKGAADALAARLRSGGHAAHVDGTVAPFRVRIGHYATREQAVAAQKQLAQRKIAGFVVAEGGAR